MRLAVHMYTYMIQTDYQPGRFISRRSVYKPVNPLVNGSTRYSTYCKRSSEW